MASSEASSKSSFKTAEDPNATVQLDPDEAKTDFTLDDEPKTPLAGDIAADAEPSSNTGEVESAAEQKQDSTERTDAGSSPLPQLPTLSVLTPLQPLPSVPSDD